MNRNIPNDFFPVILDRCNLGLGMITRDILDSQITASSSHSIWTLPSAGRLWNQRYVEQAQSKASIGNKRAILGEKQNWIVLKYRNNRALLQIIETNYAENQTKESCAGNRLASETRNNKRETHYLLHTQRYKPVLWYMLTKWPVVPIPAVTVISSLKA